ncbi:hypothetical protein SAMN05216267_103538 [Actinacidiphila rubida]|uniref:Secreted protein n=2 Tax=Actinacidiphila rubida TaxID=310780 RepID=A0A1H8RKB7_9ACTN|nr:hypothetical protein [Actinacidiphila rubida]SEO66772.1 hypothetical protein SAMN05216267_103538 [Actinacidiphila rubida]
MQPSAGPALPHTRSRSVHWLTTAVGLGAVVAAVALVQPADASVTGSPATPAAGSAGSTATPSARPAAAPDAAAATYPLGCPSGIPVQVVSHVSGDLDGDGRPETVAVVRCRADTGTPPSGVYILSAPATAGGPPRIAQMLVNPKDDREISDFRMEGRTVRATVLGFSSSTVPRCCPDMSRGYSWEWRDGHYVALPGPLANSI